MIGDFQQHLQDEDGGEDEVQHSYVQWRRVLRPLHRHEYGGHNDAAQDAVVEVLPLDDLVNLTDRPIPQRLRERAIDKMVDAIDGAGTIVRDNAPALGTTLALLAGWSLRRPLLRAAGWLWERRPFAKR